MPRKYHTSPESMGLHRLGHAELANNGQRCGTCDWANGVKDGEKLVPMCRLEASGLLMQRRIEPYWSACTHYEPRTRDDHAAHLYRPETK